MGNIAVLMSTYNGEKYLTEQLDSIIHQIGVNFELYIRDDGSKDATPNIIEKYAKQYSNVHFINMGNRINVGFNKSFFTLIDYAINNLQDYEYFAFADQDDVWFDTKLQTALIAINDEVKKSGASQPLPLYYYANKYWCDEQLKPIHQDNFNYCKNNYFDMFMLPPVYGCTSVFNRTLGEKTLEELPEQEFLYDVYMFRLACTMNSILIADRTPQMYYRRHGNNASGDAMRFTVLKHLKSLISKETDFHGMQRYITELYRLHMNDMGTDQKKLCELIIDYDKSFRKRMRLLTWREAYKRGAKASLIWIGRVLLNAI